MDDLAKALAAYEADPVNVNDRPESWRKLDNLLAAAHAALTPADGRHPDHACGQVPCPHMLPASATDEWTGGEIVEADRRDALAASATDEPT